MKPFLQNARRRTSRSAWINPLGTCFVWLLFASPGIAADYYVSNSGDDGNSGTAPAAAWRSIAKVNSFQFAPGDVVRFECGGGETHHIVARNCDLCFIGGGHQHSRKTPRGVRHVRYGNGIEFWSSAHDNLVEGCRIWDIYDAGLTNQGSGKNAQYNIAYRNNLIWNCEYSFESWNRPAESTTHNIHFEDNVCFNAGQGWSHAQRPWPAGVHLMLFSNSAKTEGFFIRRNVFHGVQNSAINIHAAQWNGLDGLVLSDNTYCQPPDTVLARWGDKSFTAAAFADYRQATQKDDDSRLVAVGGFRVEPAKVELRVGENRLLRATVVYTSETSLDVTPFVCFQSSNASVAAVHRWGQVCAKSPGKAKIAVAINGSSASVAVTVEP